MLESIALTNLFSVNILWIKNSNELLIVGLIKIGELCKWLLYFLLKSEDSI